jgi:acetyl-CoA carboxylase carboxyl transferase subunit alpha
MEYTLEFEKPVFELENQIRELKESSSKIDLTAEIQALQAKVDKLIREIYKNLSPWERTLLSRHPARPHAIDYIEKCITDFHEIHGDRRFSDDPSMVCGFGYLEGQRVAVLGIEKGRKTQEKIRRNFGMAQPEGYRKALRLMEMASTFGVPVLTFVYSRSLSRHWC